MRSVLRHSTPERYWMVLRGRKINSMVKYLAPRSAVFEILTEVIDQYADEISMVDEVFNVFFGHYLYHRTYLGVRADLHPFPGQRVCCPCVRSERSLQYGLRSSTRSSGSPHRQACLRVGRCAARHDRTGRYCPRPIHRSRSTLIAAEKTGRRCRGVELDPLYVDVILRRYEAVTGRQAVLESTGEAYAKYAWRLRAHGTGSRGSLEQLGRAGSAV